MSTTETRPDVPIAISALNDRCRALEEEVRRLRRFLRAEPSVMGDRVAVRAGYHRNKTGVVVGERTRIVVVVRFDDEPDTVELDRAQVMVLR